MKREFVMLAQKYDELKHSPAGWMWSQKLDGQRAIWDGGITSGMKVSEVPWANTEKDSRYMNQNIYSTGLWSRNAKVIQAPSWWLDKLPKIILDGELYAGKGNFQLTSSIVRQLIPGDDWQIIKYHVFDSPKIDVIFCDGIINTTFYKKIFLAIDGWAKVKGKEIGLIELKQTMFELIIKELKVLKIENDTLIIEKQEMLPNNTNQAKEILDQKLNQITISGGEGIMLRKAWSCWRPERSHDLLKVKKWLDGEGKVIGYCWGKKTAIGGRLLGLMGAMIIEWNGKIFELSGFTDQERQLVFIGSGNSAKDIGKIYQGQVVDHEFITNPSFPLNSMVTFKYRELTDSGLPKESRYYRKAIIL